MKLLEQKVDQGQQTIGYDQFMPQPLHERRRIVNDVSAENRALLIKTHVKRWLAANRSRLDHEQIAVVEELIGFISPEKYQVQRDEEKVMKEAEALHKKAEPLFSPEDMVQIMTNRADYVPPVEEEES